MNKKCCLQLSQSLSSLQVAGKLAQRTVCNKMRSRPWKLPQKTAQRQNLQRKVCSQQQRQQQIRQLTISNILKRHRLFAKG